MKREKLYAIIGYILFGVFIAGLALLDLSTTTANNGYIYQPSR